MPWPRPWPRGIAAAEQGRDLLAQAEAAAKMGETRVAELEQRLQALDALLQGANADVTRLRSERAARVFDYLAANRVAAAWAAKKRARSEDLDRLQRAVETD